MNALNLVTVEGNMVREPEFRVTAGGKSLCTFSIAHNRYYRAGAEVKDDISFFDCVSWGVCADSVKEHGCKGRGVRVTGKLRQERWADDAGANRSRVVITVERVEFRTRKSGSDGGGEDAGGADDAESEGVP